jgi:hypothetical protein
VAGGITGATLTATCVIAYESVLGAENRAEPRFSDPRHVASGRASGGDSRAGSRRRDSAPTSRLDIVSADLLTRTS